MLWSLLQSCTEVSATLEASCRLAQTSQLLQNLPILQVYSHGILNVSPHVNVLTGEFELALAESESNLLSSRGVWGHLEVFRSTGEVNQSVWEVSLLLSDQSTFCWCSAKLYPTVKNDLTRCVTDWEAVCGPVIHSIFDAWHYEVQWTCAWMWRVFYQLYMITRNCARFYQTRESQRADAWGHFFLTCNAMEHGRARGMMPLVKYFLHIELWIAGEPRLISLVKYFLPIKLRIAGEPGLMPLVKKFLHIELWIVGDSEACYLSQDVHRSSHETRVSEL